MVSVLFLSGKQARLRRDAERLSLHNKGNSGVRSTGARSNRLLSRWRPNSSAPKSSRATRSSARGNGTQDRPPQARFSTLHRARIGAEQLASRPDSAASLLGLEGGYAATYFGAYTTLFPPSLEFTKRVRRPPTDPVNALLSLCYTLLHYEAVREIEVIGLDPTIGFLHEFSYGRESLACDLVEAHRPAVDRFVWQMFRDRILTARDFSRESGGPGCYLTKEGRKKLFPLHEQHMKELRTGMVSDVRELARKILDE